MNKMEGTAQQSQRRKSFTKSTTATVGPARTSLEGLVGRQIKIKTASNEQIEGRIFTYDRVLNFIALDILFDSTVEMLLTIKTFPKSSPWRRNTVL